MVDNSVIEGSVKFRDRKKWKSRWCVMRKLSPVADCLHLQLYRDSKDRYKQSRTKASLSLQHFWGLETGFTLDKESHTIAILCQDLVVVLAFDNRERLMQWQVKLSSHLCDGPHFLVLVASAPPKSKLPLGPARLHVFEKGFCLTTGVPPRVAGHWQISNLRKYGNISGKFCFEGGSRCLKGEGLYILLTDQADEITSTLKLSAFGQLYLVTKSSEYRNSSVMESPRKSRLNNGIDIETEDLLLSRVNSPYTDLESNYDCEDVIFKNGWNQPPLERCVSCISKLGVLSRSSTLTNTTVFWEHMSDRYSMSSSSDSSGWSQAIKKKPLRPPKVPTSKVSLKNLVSTKPYLNYDVPKLPIPLESNPSSHYDTPRKLKECINEQDLRTIQQACGCVIRFQDLQAGTCACSFFTSRSSNLTDVSNPMRVVNNYFNTNQDSSRNSINIQQKNCNYQNMEFVKTLQLYENSKSIKKSNNKVCKNCGHSQNQYLMMDPIYITNKYHPGYITMSPAVNEGKGKISYSNPSLTSSFDGLNLHSVSNFHKKRANSTDSSISPYEYYKNDYERDLFLCPHLTSVPVRRSSSLPSTSNRDSSSSNDSGVFVLSHTSCPLNTTLPRKSKSFDPFLDLNFQLYKPKNKLVSEEREVPVCISDSTSSATSDMSDYFETISLSSHGSSDAPTPICTLRPRTGEEYLNFQRLIVSVPEEQR